MVVVVRYNPRLELPVYTTPSFLWRKNFSNASLKLVITCDETVNRVFADNYGLEFYFKVRHGNSL